MSAPGRPRGKVTVQYTVNCGCGAKIVGRVDESAVALTSRARAAEWRHHDKLGWCCPKCTHTDEFRGASARSLRHPSRRFP